MKRKRTHRLVTYRVFFLHQHIAAFLTDAREYDNCRFFVVCSKSACQFGVFFDRQFVVSRLCSRFDVGCFDAFPQCGVYGETFCLQCFFKVDTDKLTV